MLVEVLLRSQQGDCLYFVEILILAEVLTGMRIMRSNWHPTHSHALAFQRLEQVICKEAETRAKRVGSLLNRLSHGTDFESRDLLGRLSFVN